MALGHINSIRANLQAENTNYAPESLVSEALFSEVISAYLTEFLAFAPMERLKQAWALACSLLPLWKLYSISAELSWAEKDSPRHTMLVAELQRAARKLIATAEKNTS
jgi:hypothetical protein